MIRFTHLVKLLVLVALCACTGKLQAQVGYMDTSYHKSMGVDFKCTGGLMLPDNKVIIIGRFAYVHDRLINCIARLNPDGTNDYTFNPGIGANEHINAVIRQADGKLVIAGDFTMFNGVTVNHICRLMPDGALDPSFLSGTGLTVSGTVYSLYQQNDGKILVGGIFSSYDGLAANNIIRLNSDGTYDNTFLYGTGFNNAIYSIDVQPDSKVLVAGSFTSYNGDATAIRVIRLKPDGDRDLTFVTQYGANNTVTAAYHTAGGKVVLAGYFTLYDSVACNRVAQLNANGTFDYGFSVGLGFNSNVNELAIQADGKILAAGGFTTYNGISANRIVRLNTDGTKDASFYIGSGLNLSANYLFIGDNDNIYIGGTFTTVDSFAKQRLVKLYPSGKVNHTFMRETKVNNQVLAVANQSNGKAIIVGQFTRYNAAMANRIARLNLDGTLDETFNQGTGANNTIRTILVQPDDKILIGGDFTTYNGVTRNRIARLNADGTLDTSFDGGAAANGAVYKIQTAPSGGFYIVGAFTAYASTSRVRIAKITATGTLDVSFVPGGGFNNIPADIGVQADGKVVVAGSFTAYAGITANRLARINPTGLIDSSYTANSLGANNVVLAVIITPSGKAIIGGSFTTYNNVAKQRVAQLNVDGSIDTSFNASFNSTVTDLVMVGSKVFACGDFTLSNSVPWYRIALLEANNGANDIAFSPSPVFGIANGASYHAPLRRIFIGGNYGIVNDRLSIGHTSFKVTNIDLEEFPTQLCWGAVAYAYFGKRVAFPTSNSFSVQLSDSTGKFTNPIVIGAGFNNASGEDSIDVLIPNNIPYGNNYYVRIVGSAGDTSNVIGPISIQVPVVPTVTASGPTAVCPGQSVLLTSSSALTYQWNNGATTQSIVADSTKNYFVTTNSYNCTATSAPIAVSTNNVPDSSIVATAGSFCSGGSVMLTASSNNRYVWSTGDTTQTIYVTQSGSYTLVITSAANCVADSTVIIDFSSIGNYLIVENGPTSFCQGGSVTLTSVPNASYVWSTGATTQSIVVTQPGSYTVTVTDNNNCSLASNNKVVTVNAPPSATVTASGPTTFCAGDSVTLSATNGLNYAWNNGATTRSITALASGFFNVTVTDPNSNCSAVSSTTTVNVNSRPTVTYNQPENTVCNGGGIIQLTGASPAGGVFSGSGVSGTSFNPSAQSGSVVITYTYTDGNNCSAQATDAVNVDICSGIYEADAALISIYPNPATSVLNIVAGGQNIDHISISDLSGKVIMDEVPQIGAGIVTLNVEHLTAGTYIISVGNARSRFIKTN